MKLIIVATPQAKGHHKSYFELCVNSLIKKEHSVVSITQEKHDIQVNKQYYIQNNMGTRRLSEYLKMVKELRNIIEIARPDAIHIQCGDNFYRFMGIGLSFLKKYRTFFSFHQYRNKIVKPLYFKLLGNLSKGCMVHSEILKTHLEEWHIPNVNYVRWPQTVKMKQYPTEVAKEFFGINKDSVVLAYIGGTGYVKGLDILLESLKGLEIDFTLLIAGVELDFKKDFITSICEGYKNKVKLALKYLTDDELNYAFCAADYIVLPYRKSFEAGSGILTNAVWMRKPVIAADRGELGKVVKNNELGYLFEPENKKDLRVKISNAIKSKYVWNQMAEKYREAISPEYFMDRYNEMLTISN